MDRIPIIMDVDTGVDDAMAIMLALSEDRLDLLGITTVAGNQTLDKTTANTLGVLELLGRADIPVAAGAERSLLLHPLHSETGAAVHGSTGLGNAKLPAPQKRPEPVDAVGFLRTRLERSPVPVTLVPVGPLTNIALLLLSYPHLKGKIKELVIMGGGAYRGNNTTVAEFNIAADPEAARVVFDSGLPVTMCGLDVTMKAVVEPDEIEQFRALGTPAGTFCAAALGFYAAAYRRYEEMDGGCAVHDAVAVCCLLRPELVRGRRAHVTVDLDGRLTRGCTTTDLRGYIPDEKKNATVMLDIDRERFVRLLLDAAR